MSSRPVVLEGCVRICLCASAHACFGGADLELKGCGVTTTIQFFNSNRNKPHLGNIFDNYVSCDLRPILTAPEISNLFTLCNMSFFRFRKGFGVCKCIKRMSTTALFPSECELK